MVIEANTNNLTEYLKSRGSSVPLTNTVNPVPNNPLEPLNNGVTNTSNSLDTFTKLLESINRLLSQPIIKGAMEKGIQRKERLNQTEELQAPEGYNPPNSTMDNNKQIEQKPTVSKESNTEKATLFYQALLKSVEELVKQNPERTIKEIHEELVQETKKEHLIKQIEVIL